MQPVILLLSDKAEDLAFAMETSWFSGFSLVQPKVLGDALVALKKIKNPIIFANCKADADFVAFKKSFGPLIGHQAGQISPNSVHMLGHDDPEASSSRISELFGHYLFKATQQPEESGRLYGNTIRVLSGERSSEIEGILSSQDTWRAIKLARSGDRSRVCQRVAEFLVSEADLSERISLVLVNAVDELLMHAIYEAPVDAGGRQIFENMTRTAPVVLKGKHSVEFKMGYDKSHVVFVVTDQFGSLNSFQVIKSILGDRTGPAYLKDGHPNNEGLGFLVTFKNGGSLIFRLEPYVKTEVTLIFRNARSFVEQKNQFRFLSMNLRKGKEKISN